MMLRCAQEVGDFSDAGDDDLVEIAANGDPIALGRTVWVLGVPVFVRLHAGIDMRSDAEISAERDEGSFLERLIISVLTFFVCSTVLMCGLTTMYLIKSLLGLDLMVDHSIFHGLFFD